MLPRVQAATKLRQWRRELVDPWFEPPPQPLTGTSLQHIHESRVYPYCITRICDDKGLGTLLADTLPPEQLADPDSQFVSVNGIRLHIKQTGSNPEAPAVLLLHGFNGSVFNWCTTCGGGSLSSTVTSSV